MFIIDKRCDHKTFALLLDSAITRIILLIRGHGSCSDIRLRKYICGSDIHD